MKQPKSKTPRSYRPPEREPVMQFFFEGGNPRRPRREVVRRDELYQVLEWYHEHAIRRNRWHRRLWRALRRLPVGRLDPFAWIRLRRENANTGGGHGPEALQ